MKIYEAPKLTVIDLAAVDIICTSGSGAPPTEGLTPEDRWEDM